MADLLLEMPSGQDDEAAMPWETKDYRDLRYSVKRALYLAVVAKLVKEHFDSGEAVGFIKMQWISDRGDVRRPILELAWRASEGSRKGKPSLIRQH